MSEWHSELEADRKRREDRLHEKTSRPSARKGTRKPEWQCCRCSRTMFMDRDVCRGKDCGKMRDPHYDACIDERGNKQWEWPREHSLSAETQQARRWMPPTTYAEAVGAAPKPPPQKHIQQQLQPEEDLDESLQYNANVSMEDVPRFRLHESYQCLPSVHARLAAHCPSRQGGCGRGR